MYQTTIIYPADQVYIDDPEEYYPGNRCTVKKINLLPENQYKCIGYLAVGKYFDTIIKFGIPADAENNLDRKTVDKNFATFKSNKVHVLDIYNKFNKQKLAICYSSDVGAGFPYKVGTEITTEYNSKHGINFYTTVEAAINYSYTAYCQAFEKSQINNSKLPLYNDDGGIFGYITADKNFSISYTFNILQN